MRKIIKNKRGALGETLVWLGAIFPTFLVLLLFIAGAIVMSLKRNSIIVAGEDVKGSDVISTKTLISIMNTPIEYNGESFFIKKLILKWSEVNVNEKEQIDKIIEEQVRKDLEQVSDENCYIFEVKDWDSQDIDERVRRERQESGYEGLIDPKLDTGPSEQNAIHFHNVDLEKYNKNLLLEKAEELYLFSDKGNILIKFYFGDCQNV